MVIQRLPGAHIYLYRRHIRWIKTTTEDMHAQIHGNKMLRENSTCPYKEEQPISPVSKTADSTLEHVNRGETDSD